MSTRPTSPRTLEAALSSRHRPVLTIIGSKNRLDLDFQRFTVYVIKVKIGTYSNRIIRRCSQFYELDSECRKFANVDLPALPKKHFFKSSTDKAVVRGRVSVLQKYLDAVAASPRLMRSPFMAKWLCSSQNPGCLSLDQPDFEGFLFKQGHVVRNWKQRYFILKEDLLYYLRSKDDMNPLGALSLAGARIEADGSKKHCLRLIPSVRNSQPLLIAASSANELHRWKMALQQASALEVRKRDSHAQVPKLQLDDIGGETEGVRRSTVSVSPLLQPSSGGEESPSRLSRIKTDPLDEDYPIPKYSPRRDTLLGSVGSIPSMMTEHQASMRLKRTGSDTIIDTPHSEDSRPSVARKVATQKPSIDEALLDTKATVDENLESFLVSVNQALVRSRFSDPNVVSPPLIPTQEKKSGDRRSQLMKADSAVCSPRVNAEVTSLLETLKDIAVTFQRLTVEDLLRDGNCKEIVIGVQALSSQYVEAEQKAFINSLLFILSPFSRLIALQRFASKRQRPTSTGKSATKSAEGRGMESLLNTGIMRAVAFIGSAVGISVARTMQYSQGSEGKPYSPALTPRRILDGNKRDSDVMKAVHRRRTSKEALLQDPPKAKWEANKKVPAEQFRKPVHSFLVKMQQERDVPPPADDSVVDLAEEYSVVNLACETCDEHIQAHVMKEHAVYCKIASDIMKRCGESDWNAKITALADGVHDRIEEVMEEDQVSIHLVSLEKIARDAAKLGATFVQRDQAEKLLVSLRDLLMHGKHVEETALLAFGLPLFNAIRMKYLSVIPVSELKVKKAQQKVTVESFVKIKPISKGAFGRVDLVCRKGTDHVYARKTLRKSDMIDKNLVDQVITERNILATTQNPYVVQMYYAFQNKSNLFLFMEYLPGGDCASLLENVGYFDVGMAKLYIAETIMAIAYLHSKGVVHRDVKPDNLLISSEGHIKLTDFGLSRVGFFERAPAELASNSEDESGTRKEKDAPKGHRVVGTPDYLSPEALLGTGTGASMDWWAAGVTLFEFLTGVPPFNDDTPEKIFQNILNRDIPWPDVPDEMPEDAQDLICKLLTMDPAKRLGANGVEEIKSHEFFHDINWDTLYLEPRQNTFVPRVADKFDTGYFTPRGSPDPGAISDPSDRDSFAGPEDGIDVPDKQREELFAGFSWRYLPDEDTKMLSPARVTSPGRPMLLHYRTEQLEAHRRASSLKTRLLSSDDSDDDYGEVLDETSSSSIFSQS